MTEAEYDRIRALCGKWYAIAEDWRWDTGYITGLRGCADDLKAVLDSFSPAHAHAHVEQHVQQAYPGDSCSTCGAEPNEPCRDGCAYAARTHRGWRDVPRTVLGERVLEEITEMRRDFPDDI